MPSVDLIRVYGYFFELNILCIEGTNNPKCCGKEGRKFRGFRYEKRRRKVENTLVQGWGNTPPIAPKDNICP